MTRYLTQTVLGLFFGALIAFGCFHVGACTSAHADTMAAGSAAAGSAAAVPDPIAHPGDAASLLSKLYHSGAWLCLGIVALFFLIYALDKKFAWFEKDAKHAAYTAAALGALAMLAVPASQGTTPNLQMIVAALGTGIALVINPKKAASS